MNNEDIPELHERAVEAIQRGDRELAERLERQLIALIEAQEPDRELRELLAVSYYNLGTILSEQGRSQECMPFYKKALDALPALLQEERTPELRNLQGQVSFNTGNSYLDAQDHQRALEMFEQAGKAWKSLTGEFPDEPQYRNDLARSLFNRAYAHQLLGQSDRVVTCFCQAITLWEELLEGFDEVPAWRFDLGRACFSLGETYRQAGKLDEAVIQLRQAVHHFGILLRNDPDRNGTVAALQQFHDSLCRALAESEHPDALPAAIVEFVELIADIASDLPENSALQVALARLAYLQADSLSRLPDQSERAESAYRQAIALYETFLSAVGDNEDAREALAGVWFDLAMLLRGQSSADLAEQSFANARLHLERLLVEEPDNSAWQARLADVHNNLGILSSDIGRLRRAESAYRLALRVREGIERRFPDDLNNRVFLAGTLCNLAHVLRRRGLLDEALKLYERAEQLLESAWDAPVGGGLVRTYLENTRAGRVQALEPQRRLRTTHLETATLAWRPAGPPPIFATPLPAKTPGQDLYEQGQYEEALTRFDERTPVGRHGRARALARLGRLEESLAELTALRGVNPEDANVRRDRADVLRCLGRAEDALTEADLAVALSPREPGGWFLRGLVLGGFLDVPGEEKMEPFDRDRNAEAIEAFDRCLELAPEDALCWRYRGRALSRSCHAAQAGYNALVGLLAREDAPAQELLDLAEHRRSEFWELFGSALESFEEVARLRPEEADTWRDLAGHLTELTPGFEISARAALEKLVQLKPDDAQGWYQLAGLLSQSGQTKEAREHLERALALEPGLAKQAEEELGELM